MARQGGVKALSTALDPASEEELCLSGAAGVKLLAVHWIQTATAGLYSRPGSHQRDLEAQVEEAPCIPHSHGLQ